MTANFADAAQMNTTQMDAAQALEAGLALPYALTVTCGSVTLGETPAQVDPDDLIEARFFSTEREIHLFREDGTLRAVSLSDADTGDAQNTNKGGRTETDNGTESGGKTEKYKLLNSRLGEWIEVKSYVDYDGDGQAYVCARRLAGWKGGKGHG